MDRPPHPLVAFSAAVALQQFDLQVVERVEVGEAVADRALEHGVAVEQFGLAHDRQQRVDRGLPLGFEAREDGVAQRFVLDQLRVALDVAPLVSKLINHFAGAGKMVSRSAFNIFVLELAR